MDNQPPVNVSHLKLEYIFTCDPISRRGKEALKDLNASDESIEMSIDDFYQKIYSEPFFCDLDREKSEAAFEGGAEHIYDDFAFTVKRARYRELNQKKFDFEELFLSKATDPFLFVRGASGCGKSIYLNYLKRKRSGLSQDAKELNFDLEDSGDFIRKGGVRFPEVGQSLPSRNGTTPTAPWLFFMILLDRTFDEIWKIVARNDKETFKRINDNFDLFYGEDYEHHFSDIFKIYSGYNGNLEDLLKIEKHSLRGELFNKIIGWCVPNHDDVSACIRNILEILTRVFLFDSGFDNSQQVLISFDSIEHYISIGRRIYDNDITIIVTSVFGFAQNEEIEYSKKNLNFSKFFKIIMAIYNEPINSDKNILNL